MEDNFMQQFPYMQQMVDQFRGMFGDDFVRQLMSSMQSPNWMQNQNAGGNPGWNPLAGMSGQGANRFGAAGSQGAPNASSNASKGASGQSAWNPFANSNMSAAQPKSFPQADVYETRHEVVVVLEVPGMERSSDIRVSVFGDQITVKGTVERRYQRPVDENLFLSERHTGNFERTIALPTRVRKQHAKAVYQAGLLEIRLVKEAKFGESEGSPLDVDFL